MIIHMRFFLRDAFFDTSSTLMGHTGGIANGLIHDPTASVDPFFVPDLKHFVLKLRRENFGRDLVSVSLMRGRDHGLPGYVHYLNYCFGYKVKDWNDLETFMPKEQIVEMKKIYRHWLDIEMYFGGFAERRIGDAAMGPTFACIIGLQYFNTKYGDRFYFEHGHEAGSFTPAQLENIRHVSSLSNILCKAGYIESAQPNAFFLESSHNAKIPCQSYPELDYSLWADNHGSYS